MKSIRFEIFIDGALVREETIERSIIKIGTLPSSHLNLKHPSVSRMHAVIEQSGDEVSVIDLGSARGTLVGGRRVNKHSLRSGDELTFGEVVVRVTMAESASGVEAPGYRDETPVEPERDTLEASLESGNFMGQNLRKVDLSSRELDGADLRLTDLRDANLTGASLKGARLYAARLEGANLTNALLEGVDLRQCSADVRTRWPKGFDPESADLRVERAIAGVDSRRYRRDLSGLELQNADLRACRFDRTMLRGACFDGAVLDRASFLHCDLSGASFVRARVSDVDFRFAELHEVNMSEATIDMADFHANGLDKINFSGARGFESAVWPMLWEDFDFEALAKPPEIGQGELRAPKVEVLDSRPSASTEPQEITEPPPLAEPLEFKLYPDSPDDDSWGLRVWRSWSDSDVLGTVLMTEHTLRLLTKEGDEKTRISWERPFYVSMAVWLLDDEGLELTLSIRHAGQKADEAIKLKVDMAQARVPAQIPLQQVRAPYLALEALEQIWRRVVWYSQLHGTTLRAAPRFGLGG